MLRALVAIIFCFALAMEGNEIKLARDAPLHDAILTQVASPIPLKAIDVEPPAPLNEDIPFQTDAQSIWINGYWDWDPANRRFLWISGVWRRPPLDQKWNIGQWKRYNEGWVRFRGYWSPSSISDPTYIHLQPPEPISEYPKNRPSNANYWLPGYWHFFSDSQEFGWVSGTWQNLDPDWVLIPSHYIWQPKGYVFIPAYWDWPLEKNGRVYTPIAIKNTATLRTAFQPVSFRTAEEVINQAFLVYPNYLPYLQHHYEYHPEFWSLFRDTPPWWRWPLWWSLTWPNQWGLWWWYTHPGYPQPDWINEALAKAIPAPYRALVNAMRKIVPPSIVTPTGAISISQLLKAMEVVESKGRVIEGGITPIISADSSIAKDIAETAGPPAIDPQSLLVPSGFGSRISKLTPEQIAKPLQQLNTNDSGRLQGREVRSTLIRNELPKKPPLHFLHPIRLYKTEEATPIYKSQHNTGN